MMENGVRLIKTGYFLIRVGLKVILSSFKAGYEMGENIKEQLGEDNDGKDKT